MSNLSFIHITQYSVDSLCFTFFPIPKNSNIEILNTSVDFLFKA